MKRSLALWQLGGYAFTAALGTLLHFLYVWTDCVAVTPFSAVNESTWEHMKLAFFPMLIFGVIQAKFFKEDSPCFWWVKLVGILIGGVLIPTLFYTYNGSFGKTPDWLNILFFFLATGLAYLIEAWLFKRKSRDCSTQWIPITLLALITIAFFVFTFSPPKFPLFQDPITGGYGLIIK